MRIWYMPLRWGMVRDNIHRELQSDVISGPWELDLQASAVLIDRKRIMRMQKGGHALTYGYIYRF